MLELVINKRDYADFVEIAKEIKKSYFSNETNTLAFDVIDGVGSWRVSITRGGEDRDHDFSDNLETHYYLAQDFIDYNNLEGILTVDDVVEKKLLPLDVEIYTEYDGEEELYEGIVGILGHRPEFIADRLYETYKRTLKEMIDKQL
jgi:hypothetical protein